MMTSDPCVVIWQSQADFQANKPPLRTIQLNPMSSWRDAWSFDENSVVSSGSYVLVMYAHSPMLHYSGESNNNRLAIWELDPSGAVVGDSLRFDGSNWTPKKLDAVRVLYPLVGQGTDDDPISLDVAGLTPPAPQSALIWHNKTLQGDGVGLPLRVADSITNSITELQKVSGSVTGNSKEFHNDAFCAQGVAWEEFASLSLPPSNNTSFLILANAQASIATRFSIELGGDEDQRQYLLSSITTSYTAMTIVSAGVAPYISIGISGITEEDVAPRNIQGHLLIMPIMLSQ